MSLVKGIQNSKVPTSAAPSRGTSGKTKRIKGKGVANVMPKVKAPTSGSTRGGPAQSIRGGGISSGGGSFGQK